jgi:hypothetical protein
VIVNQTLARQLSQDENPIGRFVRLDEQREPVEVVGIARDAKYRTLGEDPQPFLYLPLRQYPSLRMALHVASRGPEDLIGPIREQIRGLDRELPLDELSSVDDALARSLWAPRLAAIVLSVFAGVALLLSAVGVYGVTAFSVSQRRRELGIRFALGARRISVVGTLLHQEMRIVALGALCGALTTLILSRWIGSVLYVDGETRLLPLVWSALTLLAVAFLATLFPSLHAANTDPLTAIDSE